MACTNKVPPPVQILGVAHNGDPLVVQSPPVPLSKEERLTFAELEEAIAKGGRAFVDMGFALKKIREEKLYRDYHESFDAYCRGRWGFSRQRANQLIGAAERATRLATIVATVAPTNESQVRPLVGRPDDEAIEIWKEANSLAAGAPVTGLLVKKAIKNLLGEAPKPERSFADLLENVFRSCRLLEEHLRNSDLTDLDEAEKSRLASATRFVVLLAQEAGCLRLSAGSPADCRWMIAVSEALQSSLNVSHRRHTNPGHTLSQEQP